MDGQWLSYAEAAARLGVSVEAVRQRAIRNKWARTLGNDKRARIRLPDEPYPTQTPVVRAPDPASVTALESHIKTLQGDNEALKERLDAAEARADKAIAAFAALAERLDALAAERSRPWWRRIAG